MAEAEEILTRAFATRGYGVLATLEPHKIGDRLPGANQGIEHQRMNHPFLITEETDKEDWQEQARLSGFPATLNGAYRYFYRVTTD